MAVSGAVSYAPPVIGTLTGPGIDSGTQGHELVVISGGNFGPHASKLDYVQYRAREGDTPRYSMTFINSSCELVSLHTTIHCHTLPGAGTDLEWQVVIDGQASVLVTYGYKSPLISRVEVPVGGFNTGGGELLRIIGDDLGTDASLDSVTYGPLTNTAKYTARGCNHTIPHREIVCWTMPGVGAGLQVEVIVGAQSSLLREVTFGADSQTQIWYAPPRVYSLDVVGSAVGEAETRGGQILRLRGENLGSSLEPPTVTLEHPVYAPPGGVLAPLLQATASEVQVLIPEGLGRDWDVKLDLYGAVNISRDAFHYRRPYVTEWFQLHEGDAVYTLARAQVIAQYGNDTAFVVMEIVGGSYGAAGTAIARTDIGAPIPIAQNASANMWTHGRVRLVVLGSSGTLDILVGGQTLASPLQFNDDTPYIKEPITLTAGAEGQRPGATTGNFTVHFIGGNLGLWQPGQRLPKVSITVGGAPCPLIPWDLNPDGSFPAWPGLRTDASGNGAEQIIQTAPLHCHAPVGQGYAEIQIRGELVRAMEVTNKAYVV